MDQAAVSKFMCELGISRNPANLAAVIRFVQRAEGHVECFGNGRKGCTQYGCAWRSLCMATPVGERTTPGMRPPRAWSGEESPLLSVGVG